jgi:hypothetical protein
MREMMKQIGIGLVWAVLAACQTTELAAQPANTNSSIHFVLDTQTADHLSFKKTLISQGTSKSMVVIQYAANQYIDRTDEGDVVDISVDHRDDALFSGVFIYTYDGQLKDRSELPYYAGMVEGPITVKNPTSASTLLHGLVGVDRIVQDVGDALDSPVANPVEELGRDELVKIGDSVRNETLDYFLMSYGDWADLTFELNKTFQKEFSVYFADAGWITIPCTVTLTKLTLENLYMFTVLGDVTVSMDGGKTQTFSLKSYVSTTPTLKLHSLETYKVIQIEENGETLVKRFLVHVSGQ